METLITTSGYTVVPPSGLAIVSNSIQLSAATGDIVVSGSLGTLNHTFVADENTPLEVHFLMLEDVTVTPSAGTAIFNYVYAGSPICDREYEARIEYANASGVQKWPTVILSGSYATGFGG